MHIKAPLTLKVPYCDTCYSRVRRLTNWKDGIFMIPLVPGAIVAVLYSVAVFFQQGVLALFGSETVLGMMFAFMLFFGLSYAVMWLVIFPLRLVLRSKFADPGVKVAKTKQPGMVALDFSNPGYAHMFSSANGLSVPGKGS